MKKTLRIFGAFLALVSLTACQDLGSEITANEAKAKQAAILNPPEDKVPHAYTITVKETIKISASGESSGNMDGTVTMKTGYDMDKLFLFEQIDSVENSGGQKETEKGTRWAYYKDGYFHEVSSDKDGKNTGTKAQMTEAEAKVAFQAYLGESELAEADIENITDGIGSLAGNIEGAVAGLKIESSEKWYSKGDGNLSYQAKQKGSSNANGVKINYSFNCLVTINDYMLSNLSYKIDYSGSGQGYTAALKLNASMSGSKSCAVSYPTYTLVS